MCEKENSFNLDNSSDFLLNPSLKIEDPFFHEPESEHTSIISNQTDKFFQDYQNNENFQEEDSVYKENCGNDDLDLDSSFQNNEDSSQHPFTNRKEKNKKTLNTLDGSPSQDTCVASNENSAFKNSSYQLPIFLFPLKLFDDKEKIENTNSMSHSEDEPKKVLAKKRKTNRQNDYQSCFKEENMRKKIKVKFQNISRDFLNKVIGPTFQHRKSFQIQKLNSEQTSNVTKKKKKSHQNESLVLDSLSNQLKSTVIEYFSQPISKKCSTYDENWNAKVFKRFFAECEDRELVEKIKDINLKYFYETVFLKGINILGEKYDDLIGTIPSFEVQINQEIYKKSKGIEKRNYYKRLIHYAKHEFIPYYLTPLKERKNSSQI